MVYSLILGTSAAPLHSMKPPSTQKIDGLSFVAPPRPFPENPMPAVKSCGADWIAVIPYGFCRKGEATVHYNPKQWQQWWGERPEGVRKTIEMAKAAGLKVILKPQVYVPGDWTGGIDFDDPAEWEKWEAGYTEYIMPFVEMAEELEVEAFCIGTEFKVSERKRPTFWALLAQQIRRGYSGKLTYASNWDSYQDVPFWEALDWVGVDAYFPLIEDKTPSVKRLKQAWQPQVRAFRKFYEEHQIPIVFTEFGYLSVDGCAGKTWELEPKVNHLPMNEQAQANALDAFFEVHWDEDYCAGAFLWKWFPNEEGHEGYLNKDYTPQGKKGEAILKKWWE